MFLVRLSVLCPHFKLLSSLRLCLLLCVDVVTYEALEHGVLYTHSLLNTHYIRSSFDYMNAPGLGLISQHFRHAVQI